VEGLKAADPRHVLLDPEMIALDALLQVLGAPHDEKRATCSGITALSRLGVEGYAGKAEHRATCRQNSSLPRLDAMNWPFRPHPALEVESTVAKDTEKLDPGFTTA